jgi:hypothetical protein
MKRFSLLLLVLALPLCAQYQINWSTHDSGGGASTGGAYTLAGTVGQPDAGAASGGAYTLAGGFWSAFSEAEPETPPVLRIELTSTRALLFWLNPSTGYQLQQSTSLAPAAWTDVLTVPEIVGAEKRVTLAREAAGERYFRLRKP